MKHRKIALIIIADILISSALLYIIAAFSRNHVLHNLMDYLKIMLMFNFIFILRKFRLQKITIGCLFVLISWIAHFVYTLQLYDYDYFISDVYDFFSFTGVLLLLYGIWQSIKDNGILVDKLQKLAFYDRLTKLPNRNLILDSCPVNEQGIKCERGSICVCNQRPVLFDSTKKSSILFIDIDDFRMVNNSLGHFYGDAMLEQIAKRLRESLSSEDVVIRLAGDEFLVICYNVFTNEEISPKTGTIIRAMSDAFNILGKEISISCSIGIAFFPEHGRNIEKVIQKADIAMNAAKKEGKNQFFIYNDLLEKDNNNRYDVINDLKVSLKNKDFVIYYQPKASLETGEITGLEALVRWNHPKRGLVYPNDFIPLAEETGLIKDLDTLVINLVCQQLAEWKQEGRKPYNISINISPVVFNDKFFINKLDAILANYQINPSDISIEITENIAFNDAEQTRRKIIELRKRKIQVHLDDFGKGYSSLTYIKQYPIDCLKIDKSFIDDIQSNKIDQALVSTVIKVAKLLGIKVISEGVETKEQLEFLKNIGCNEYQGYLLSKPVPYNQLNLDKKLN